FLLRNAANLINRRKQNANAKAAQYGMDPVSSSYQMEDDIMDSVAGQAGDIYTKSIESSQNKAKLLTALNSQEEDDSDIFSDILSGAGIGLNAVSRFYKPMNTGGILPNDPEVPKNKDVYPTMLAKNEGVLNSEAMSLPGVKEFVKRMNKVGLSLREKTPSSASGHSPLVKGRQHLKDGGVIGEAKKEEKTKKKTRKGAGTSLKDRIMEGNFSVGELLGNAGYSTMKNLMDGNLPENLDERTLGLMNNINSISDRLGKYKVDPEIYSLLDNNGLLATDEHRREAGFTYHPMFGGKLYFGEEHKPGDDAVGSVHGPEEDVAKYRAMNIHSHDWNPYPSGISGDRGMITDMDMNKRNYITHLQGVTQYDESDNADTWTPAGKKRKKRIGNILEYDLKGNQR
ncbi:MAG: hypothetical protein IT280_12900, partial [Ignavibacteria bacterium]|nr:hypothetical protein [Ignavibacteria bacterium]